MWDRSATNSVHAQKTPGDRERCAPHLCAGAIRPNDTPRSGRQEQKKIRAQLQDDAATTRALGYEEGATCKARQAVCDVSRLAAAPFPGAVASGAVAHSGHTPSLLTALLVLWNADATPRWNDETEPQSTSDRRQRTALRVQPALPLLACFFTEAFEPLYIVSELTYVSLMSLLNTATRCCCVVTVPRMRDQTRYTNSCTPYLCRTGCLRIAIDLPRFVNAHQRSFTRSSFFPSPLGLRQPRPRLERRRWVQSIYTRMRREKFRL